MNWQPKVTVMKAGSLRIRAYLLAVIFSIMGGPAMAGDAASPLKADLEKVVATGEVVAAGGLTTAGQPDAAALKVFADRGYVAVVDLRTEGEDRGMDEPAVVGALGMKYINLPIGREDITFEKAQELAEILDRFDEPVLLHCASSNRVGALLALDMIANGEDVDAAVEKGKAAGLSSLEEVVREAARSK